MRESLFSEDYPWYCYRENKHDIWRYFMSRNGKVSKSLYAFRGWFDTEEVAKIFCVVENRKEKLREIANRAEDEIEKLDNNEVDLSDFGIDAEIVASDTSDINEVDISELPDAQKKIIISMIEKFKRENSPLEKAKQEALEEIEKDEIIFDSVDEYVTYGFDKGAHWVGEELLKAGLDIESELNKLGIYKKEV